MAQDAAILQGGAQAVNFAPLWHDQDNPLERTWQALKHDLQKDAADWTFWIGFYEDLLAGRSMNWPLLHDIATTDTLDWSKGPIDLNADIMAFRDIWLAKEARAGEALYFDEEAGVFRLEVMEADDPSRLERAVFKLTEILELINATGNFSGVVKGELLLIERAVTLYPDNAFKVYNNTSQSLKLLRRNIETAACPAPADEALVDMLEMTLQEVKAMLQSEPDVISDVIPRLEKLVSEMPQEDLRNMREASEQLALLSEDSLAEQTRREANVFGDGYASDAERGVALYYSASRIVQAVFVGMHRTFNLLLDGSVSATGKLATISQNIKKISLNIAGASAVGAVSYGLGSFVLSPQVRWVLDFFHRFF